MQHADAELSTRPARQVEDGTYRSFGGWPWGPGRPRSTRVSPERTAEHQRVRTRRTHERLNWYEHLTICDAELGITLRVCVLLLTALVAMSGETGKDWFGLRGFVDGTEAFASRTFGLLFTTEHVWRRCKICNHIVPSRSLDPATLTGCFVDKILLTVHGSSTLRSCLRTLRCWRGYLTLTRSCVHESQMSVLSWSSSSLAAWSHLVLSVEPPSRIAFFAVTIALFLVYLHSGGALILGRSLQGRPHVSCC